MRPGRERFETLAQTAAGRRRGARPVRRRARDGADPREELRRRMQLKTLLFGMGETFRALLQRQRVGAETGGKSPAK